MEQQLHDKSETFKIIYMAFIVQIIGILNKYVDTNIVFSNLINLILLRFIYFDMPYFCPVLVSCLHLHLHLRI